MTPGTGILATPRRVVAVLAAAALLAGLAVVAASPATAAEGACVGDVCDDGAWATARGASNEISYWGMSSGHNCTNYVAWRLIEDGIPKPPTHPGNAGDWAENAIADGFRVDDVPTVGAVAQWVPNAGWGALGHVAYVERLNPDGTILVSEDYWRNGTQVGPLTYRIVDPDTVSNFIHYEDESDWLRIAAPAVEGWTTTGTHLDLAPTAMTSLPRDDGTGQIFYAEGGRLHLASTGADGWTATDLGVASEAESLSVVSMYGQTYLMSIDRGEVVMTVGSGESWQRMPTGIQASVGGHLSAVNLGGLFPTVFASVNGRLWQVWGDTEGWHAEFTGVTLEGAIETVADSLGRPVVFSVGGGDLVRSWVDDSGWHSAPTGLTATGPVRAVWTETGPAVYLVDGDDVWLARTDGVTWTRTPLGLDAGTGLELVDLGAAEPSLALLG